MYLLVEKILKEAESGNFKYAVVKANINLPELKDIQSKIKKEDIHQDSNNTMGLEDNPHVTLLYGLHKNVTTDDVKKALKNLKLPDTIKVKGISKFENDEYDVLKFDVDKKGLSEINTALKELPYTNKYDDYKPHLTIAYLKKGKADKYINKISDINKNINIQSIDFVDINKKKSKLK